VTQPPPLPPSGQYPPNPWAQYPQQAPRPSWTVPVLVGAFATILLHSPVLIDTQWWLPACCLVCVTGVPVGFVPALLATRRDPWMGAGSGFAVAFLAVGLGATALAIAAFAQGFHISPKTLDFLEEQMRKESRSDADIQNALQALQQAAPFIPVVCAGLLALSGGVSGAIVAAFAGRRPRHPYWPPAGPYQGQPPA
jgi:hypothetical protein